MEYQGFTAAAEEESNYGLKEIKEKYDFQLKGLHE
jgi:hypothetical protein